MIKTASSFVLATAIALALTACGGGSSDKSAADSQLSAIESAESQAAALASAVASAEPSDDPASVDVCALLSPADATSVAQADKLDGAQTASSVYKLTTHKEDDGAEDSSACRFDISDGNAEGTVLFQVGAAVRMDEYSDGTKVPGLGDEAYINSNGGSVVRVGNLLISEGDDSFTSDLTLDLLRKMAPNLK